MPKRLKVLISARNPGAANHLMVLAKALLKHNAFEPTICAQQPAFSIFRKAGINCIEVRSSELRSQATNILEETNPDQVIVGLSDPDIGIDETLISLVKNKPIYLYQDFWGALNPSQEIATHLEVLALDLEAEKLNKALGIEKTHPVGSLSHEPLKKLTIDINRTKFRRRYASESNKKITGLCLQPLWHLSSYRKTVTDFLIALRTDLLVIRFHPKNSTQDRLKFRKLLTNNYHHAYLFNSGDLNQFITSCDLIVSGLSNCNADLTEHNLLSQHGYASNAFLFHQASLRVWFQQTTRLTQHPLSALNIVKSCEKKSLLKYQLKTLQSTRIKQIQNNLARRKSTSRIATSRSIINILLSKKTAD